ncbi:DUF4304 domain-containing protein [Roseovarius aestuarii]|uniref:DUF4304 domain-containing protein n=1 Tax=Roseovarius aestuarii TaxID=475083 RepID=UPI0015949B80|nr:DUF4304 domain-containing protein [Roseovarius aestuarii]
MEAALKERCVPVLREQGFKGSFPNFYRESDKFIALVNFQYYSAGGSFCVNLGYADPERKNVFFEPQAKTNRLRVSATKDQRRLGALDGGDRWFSFGKTSYGEYRGTPSGVAEIADTCTQLLLSEAKNWWQEKQGLYQ